MKLVDRILTIVITATLTSAVWIIVGGSLIENATSEGQRDSTRPAEAAPSPEATDTVPGGTMPAPETPGPVADPLDTNVVRAPASSAPGTLQIPVLNIRPDDLTDTFSDSRSGGDRLHEAIDIMAPTGTSVVAAAPGQIERLFKSEAGGNTVYVRSTDGETIYYYAHLDEYAEGLKEGQRVRRGQRLGTVGSSGNASEDAPHLHFAIMQTTKDAEWWEPANALNPYTLLTQR
ncbi:peptidoglycan DD-metalloendopeptidase family protein [Qipengyuania sp. XHP0211]|uniref:M23 family metallopeptidase n=1 Tax=Qipengyuania sp. XHP0211 TaxID=3038079 RepID=UPI00241EE949|nr:M23 family metallopeptidase [Qipengyuania sp. XHP0211]MDG5749529.1 peptidoglycan DD-metalloendopeptidase family protein [Qipengyuania sp. XHP0211]